MGRPDEGVFAFFNEIGIIAQLSRAMMEARLPDGVTLPHFTVLNHLVRLGDGRTPLAIATAFQVPKTSMTNTLSGLARRGLVEFRDNPDDGRSKQVWLTESGRAFRDKAIADLEPDLQVLCERVPEAQVMALVTPLAAIRRALDEMR